MKNHGEDKIELIPLKRGKPTVKLSLAIEAVSSHHQQASEPGCQKGNQNTARKQITDTCYMCERSEGTISDGLGGKVCQICAERIFRIMLQHNLSGRYSRKEREP